MKFARRSAWIRVSIFLVILGVLLAWAWYSMIRMPLESYQGPLPSHTEESAALRDRLQVHVEALAADIGERNVYLPSKLRAADEYIEASFNQAGYSISRHSYEVMGEECQNLEVEVSGKGRSDELVIIGAHYDSVHGSPGANDNASGVAALLVLAERFSQKTLSRTLRFVAFVNEEPPFFMTEQMGSRVYAKRLKEQGGPVVGMISLETMGYYSEEPGSQTYPSLLNLFYPSKGNFIAFVGNTGSKAFVRECIATFRAHARFPSQGAALPSVLPGIGWSDHWSFWQEDYPALMVTDTAPFRYPYYHTAEDTPDKLDYERLAFVVLGMEKVIDALVNPEKPR